MIDVTRRNHKSGELQIMDSMGKVVVIFSLLGICILYGVSLLVVPPYVPLDEVAQHESAYIRTTGIISDLRVTESGTMRMNLRKNQTELLVFVKSTEAGKNELDLRYGDEIEVEGRVNMYQGEYEIIAPITGIKKLTRGYVNISFVSQIAMYPEQYEGTRISVVGYADDIFKRVFYICDGNSMRVVTGDIPIHELQKGDKIIADGILVYNPDTMRYELNLIALNRCK